MRLSFDIHASAFASCFKARRKLRAGRGSDPLVHPLGIRIWKHPARLRYDVPAEDPEVRLLPVQRINVEARVSGFVS